MRLPWLTAPAEALGLALDSERLGHAPLIHGPSGLGKIELARWLVARVLCLDSDGRAPCGTCRSCTLLKSGTHPDLFTAAIPEDRQQIPVDAVRDLCRGLQLTPAIGRRRVGWIEPAEAMNRNAANALLKTLEEPSPGTWLVLVSHQPERLPATIRSRCQQICVQPPSPDTAMAWLSKECPDQTEQQLTVALTAAGGAPVRALELLRDDGLAVGLEIRDTLLKLAQARPVAAAIAEEWAAHPARSWGWIAHWVHQWTGQMMGVCPRSQRCPLPASVSPETLARLWQQALEGRQLVQTTVRADLLLGKWLLEWVASFQGER
ncbi:MAG: DNA polymerase III subunit delta' [Wenzhouxiangella sp.]|nr:MAG: DNA polymerase III subunit delta' [Wenzhouxiangella sp.]